MLPPLPEWNAAHPALVHFPIGILTIVPLMMIVAALWRKARLPLSVVTLLVMIVGTVAAFVVVESGEAAAGLVNDPSEALAALIHQHAELAETARSFFAILTGCYAVVVIVGGAMGSRLKPLVWEIAHFLLIVACLIGLSILLTAAYHGGQIVHQFGIHAPI